MDKPALTEYPPPLVHKDAGYMSANRGVENLERMSLEPSAQYITKDQFGDSIDEMDMKFLLKKNVFLKTFNWSSTQTTGTILFQNIVSPAHLTGQPNPGVTTTAFDPTPFGFLGNYFTYWRGSIVFKFQVVGTAFHEGRLDFCNHPATTTVPTDYATALSQYVNSQTIRNTNNTVEVRVPFHSDIPWKRVWHGEPLSDVYSDSMIRSMDYVTGCMSVRVAVPLKYPSNVANNVDVNVFVTAGDDFEFHTLSPWSGQFTLTNAYSALRAKRDKKKLLRASLQSGMISKPKIDVGKTMDLNTDRKNDKGIIPLGVGSVYTYDPPVHHFGESYTNLREMCKRYQHLVAQPNITNTNILTDTIPFAWYGFETGGMIGGMFNCYRLFRGPLNFKLRMGASSPAATNLYHTEEFGFVTTNPQPALFGSLSGGDVVQNMHYNSTTGTQGYLNPNTDSAMVPLVRYSNKQVAEFQIPFQSIYHSLMNYLPFDDTSEYYGNQFTQFELLCSQHNLNNLTNGSNFSLALEWAFGDETRLGVFIGFPQLTMKTGTNIPYPLPGST